MVSACFFFGMRGLVCQLFKASGGIAEPGLFVNRVVQVEIPHRVRGFLVKGFPVGCFRLAEIYRIKPGGIPNTLYVKTVALAHKLALILSAGSQNNTGS